MGGSFPRVLLACPGSKVLGVYQKKRPMERPVFICYPSMGGLLISVEASHKMSRCVGLKREGRKVRSLQNISVALGAAAIGLQRSGQSFSFREVCLLQQASRQGTSKRQRGKTMAVLKHKVRYRVPSGKLARGENGDAVAGLKFGDDSMKDPMEQKEKLPGAGKQVYNIHGGISPAG